MLKKLTMTAACLLACGALAVDAVAAPGHGALKGRTKQGRKIVLARHGNRVQIKHFSIELRCHDGSYLVDAESGFVPTALQGGVRLHAHQFGNTDDVWIRARMHSHALRGAIRVHDRLGKVQCDSRWIDFHAHG